MQIKLLFKLNEPITLPLGYQYALQSLIYKIIQVGDADYSEFLHSEGYPGLSSNLKLFTFGMISGKNKINRTHITFYDSIEFEVRCVMEDFFNAFLKGLDTSDIWDLNHNPIKLERADIYNLIIEGSDITISMISPLTIHITRILNDQKKTLYLNPLNYEIQDLLSQNTRNKIAAAYGVDIDEDVTFICESLKRSDKIVTSFKNKIKITGWMGNYQLKAPPQVLTLLYNTGLGDRNSQGFGMFEVL